MAHSAGFAVDSATRFKHYGLDERILQAIRGLKWSRPTVVQATCIPLALKGKDILVRANTGTGKTASYVLPIIQSLLQEKLMHRLPSIASVIVVPTRDLCVQVRDHVTVLTRHLKKLISCIALLPDQSVAERIPLLTSNPDIIVTTPQTLFQHINSRTIELSTVKWFVIDEADMVLMDFRDMSCIRTHIPITAQVFMMSATLTEDVLDLKTRLLNAPFVVKLQEDSPQSALVTQYYMRVAPRERYLYLYGLLRTSRLKGKCLIFVNSVDEAFKLQIFFDIFGIKTSVLNSEVPENSRNHIVKRFNEGMFQHLIATDESLNMEDISLRKAELATGITASKMNAGGAANSRKRQREEPVHDTNEDAEADDDKPAWKRRRNGGLMSRIRDVRRRQELAAPEYSAHRGVDFQNVDWVINFDMSEDPTTYTHRIGRTGRAEKSGSSLSFFVTNQQDELLELIKDDQQSYGRQLIPFPCEDNFGKLKVRVTEMLDKVGTRAVRKCRVKELAKEILHSDRLKTHFQDDPADMRSLTHLATALPKSARKTAEYAFDIPCYMGYNVKSEATRKHEAFVAQQAEEKKKIERSNERKTKLYPKRIDPLTGFDLAAARRLERKQLSPLDMAILDPQGLHARLARQKKEWKIKQWKKTSNHKKGKHHSKGMRPPGSSRKGR